MEYVCMHIYTVFDLPELWALVIAGAVSVRLLSSHLNVELEVHPEAESGRDSGDQE